MEDTYLALMQIKTLHIYTFVPSTSIYFLPPVLLCLLRPRFCTLHLSLSLSLTISLFCVPIVRTLSHSIVSHTKSLSIHLSTYTLEPGNQFFYHAPPSFNSYLTRNPRISDCDLTINSVIEMPGMKVQDLRNAACQNALILSSVSEC